jgi:apolipoprotein D and lipocalin family protein
MEKGVKLFLIILASLLASCVSIPKGIEPVQNFKLERYLGTWYEIARLDHKFERGLSHVSAEYTRRDDGGVRVKNLGYSAAKDRWEETVGKAYFVADENTGHMKVTFQWPFYGSYVIFRLDDNYQYSYVTGNDRKTLWLLARTPSVDEKILQDFKNTAQREGFDLKSLRLVNQIPLD